MAVAAVTFYGGIGLIHLQERARLIAIAYFCFGAVNGTTWMARPGYRETMRQMRLAAPKLFPSGSAMPGPLWLFALLAVASCAVPIFFLVRRSQEFARPA